MNKWMGTQKILKVSSDYLVLSINQNNNQFHECDETSEYNVLKE